MQEITADLTSIGVKNWRKKKTDQKSWKNTNKKIQKKRKQTNLPQKKNLEKRLKPA